MDFDLHDRSAPQSVFNAGISVDNMSWWFWVKAGMGLAVGAGIVAFISAVLWAVFTFGLVAGVLRAFAR